MVVLFIGLAGGKEVNGNFFWADELMGLGARGAQERDEVGGQR